MAAAHDATPAKHNPGDCLRKYLQMVGIRTFEDDANQFHLACPRHRGLV